MRVPNPLLWLLAASVLAPPLLGQDIRPGGPTSAGVRAVCDLPTGQHLRNTGGSDGLGLCVFTSAELASRWQSATLAGFQQWMTRQPGGGYPEKLEEMVVRFCREAKREIPPYVQHTGGDEQILDLAVRTGRMPCITYAGRDDFYGDQVIAHMVNVAHLDQERGAVLDNNRPGVWVWMTRKQLLDRWRGVDANGRPLTVPTRRGPMQVGGGWAIVFLDGPPPPYSSRPAEDLAAGGERVVFGQILPWRRPAPAAPFAPVCPPGGCPPAAPLFLPVAPAAPPAVVEPPAAKADPPKAEPVKPAKPPAKADAPPVEAEAKNFGVDLEKMQGGKRWFHNGAETSKEDALAALAGGTLTDDSERWFLVCVGTEAERAKFAAAVKQLPPAAAGKLHVKAYAPADWQVTQFDLPAGISLRKAAANRVGPEAGRFAGEVSAEALTRFVSDALSPPPKPMPPPPTPPTPPVPSPQPEPAPAPEPAPPSTPFGIPMWLLAVVAAVVTYLLTRRK